MLLQASQLCPRCVAGRRGASCLPGASSKKDQDTLVLYLFIHFKCVSTELSQCAEHCLRVPPCLLEHPLKSFLKRNRSMAAWPCTNLQSRQSLGQRHTQGHGRRQGRPRWGKRVNGRQLEKGCGQSREREGPKEWGRIKSNRTQAGLYPACLSCSLRPHRKLPTPPALTHSLIITRHTFYSHTQSRRLAESDQGGWLHPCGE